MTMQISQLTSLSEFYFNPDATDILEEKECKCSECRLWVHGTMHFEDEDGIYELCEDCLPWYDGSILKK